MFNLCPPALIYLIFSLTHIIIDTFKGLYNTAFFKFIVMIMITFLLNVLCEGGLSLISWIIVFIPFILMTVIVSMLLYIFGLDAATGTFNYKCKDSTDLTTNTTIVTNKNTKEQITTDIFNKPYPKYSTSPQYDSFH